MKRQVFTRSQVMLLLTQVALITMSEAEEFIDSVNEKESLSFGEKAVGITFNPNHDEAVDLCKQLHAFAIDQMDELRKNYPAKARHASVAITDLETAQMRAVKAITWIE